MTHLKFRRLSLGLFACLLILIVISLSIGDSSFSATSLIDFLTGKADSALIFIISKIRLPRLLAALLGGASLAISGSILQSLTKNPLADSGILGINAGAGLVITIFTSFDVMANSHSLYLLPLSAMLGASLTVSLVYLMSRSKRGAINPVNLIITGVGLSMMLSSLMIALVGNVNPYKVNYIVNWLSGRITGDDWPSLLVLLPFLIILWAFSYWRSYQWNIMALSKETALALGLDLQRERQFALFLATSLAALSVVLIGNITFVGLIAGHISRQLIGHDHRRNILISALTGMILLLLADTITRVFLVGSNIPTGLIISMIGAPYFLYLMTKSKT